MRYLILIAVALIIVPTLTTAATLIKNDDSPELKRCVYECRNEKDIAAREACDVTCVRAEKERKKLQDATLSTPAIK